MSKNNLLFLFSLLITTYASAGDYPWPAYTAVEIPDSLSDESAFYVQNITTIDFMESFETRIIIFRRVYINSPEAAEEYSKDEMFIREGGKLGRIAARTLKKDGTSIELDESQIIRTSTIQKSRFGERSLRRVQLIYPNVEVGDVVDQMYELNLEGYIFSDLLYLEDDLPSLYSRITLRNISRLDLTAYSLNDMPPMIQKMDAGVPTISWEKSGIGKISSGYFNALSPTQPAIVFVLWKRGEPLDYNTVYAYDAGSLPEDYAPLSPITQSLQSLGVIDVGETGMSGLIKLIEFLSNDCDWTYENTDFVKQTSKFLVNKQVNGTLFLRYVMKYLKEADLRYEKGFTKSLLNGKFEHGFVSLEQLEDQFLAITDENNQIHFLFPPNHENKFYHLDEIPFYDEGNESIALYGQRDILKETASIYLPESSAFDNKHVVNLYISVDSLYTEKVKRKDVLSGHNAFLCRTSNDSDWLSEFNITKDSLFIEPTSEDVLYPYAITYLQDSINYNCFSKIGDSLLSFDMSNILPLGIYNEGEENNEFGNYLVLPYLKQIDLSVYIRSDIPLHLVDSKIKMNYESSIGRIAMEVFQISENNIKISCSLEVKKRKINGEDEISAYQDFLHQYADIRAKKWIFNHP